MDMGVYFGEWEKDFDLLSALVGFAASAAATSAPAACQWPMWSG
jgi:hypothetical protein